jgi:hypothetical protein
VEFQRDRRGRVDAGIQARRHSRIIDGVGLGSLLRDLDGNLWGELAEALVRPDRSGGAAFDGAGVAWADALQLRIQKLLRGVRLCRRGRIQDGDRLPRQDIEARHGRCEGLNPEQRTGRQARRNVRVGVDALCEGTQAINRNQHASGCEQPQLEHVTAGEVSCRVGSQNLLPVLSCILGFSQTRLRCIFR